MFKRKTEVAVEYVEDGKVSNPLIYNSDIVKVEGVEEKDIGRFVSDGKPDQFSIGEIITIIESKKDFEDGAAKDEIKAIIKKRKISDNGLVDIMNLIKKDIELCLRVCENCEKLTTDFIDECAGYHQETELLCGDCALHCDICVEWYAPSGAYKHQNCEKENDEFSSDQVPPLVSIPLSDA